MKKNVYLCIVKIFVLTNKEQTTKQYAENSENGHPGQLLCPDGTARKGSDM